MPLDRSRDAVNARHTEALRLRQQGMTFTQIADRLGYRGPNGNLVPGAARNAVMAALARTAVEGTISGRRFGVEMETVGLSRYDLAQAIEAVVGHHVPVLGYHGRTCECCGRTYSASEKATVWKVERDGSLTHRGSSHLTGEIVSPILAGDEGFATLTRVIKAVAAAGAKVNRTCGLHVHVEASDLDAQAIARLVEFYSVNGDHIDTVVAPSRRSSQWAHKYDSSTVTAIKGAAEYASGTDALRPYANKYRVVNITPLYSYGTVEFRQHQGSLNATKVTSWVKFVQAMVAAAQTAVQVDEAAELSALVETLDLDTRTASAITSAPGRYRR